MYRVVWMASAAAVIISCVVYDVASGGGLRLVLLTLVLGLFGGLFGLVFAEDRPDRWVWARRGTLWTGLGAMTVDALVTAWGGLGVLAGAALLITSPALVDTVRDRLLVRSTRRVSGPPETLTTHDLLRRWDWTTREVMRGSTSVARRLALAEERGTLLDELQRRDPTHFDDWVTTAVPGRGPVRTRGGDAPWRRGS